jgi:organic radical activating enzyme
VTSDFKSAAEQMKELLGPSLCLAKWRQVSLHLGTGMNNSCYHPPLHKIDAEAIALNPSALHNTEWKKQQRKAMLRGEKPSECSYCWSAERNGHLSDRHYRSGEPWAVSDLVAIQASTGDEDWRPSYVEVNFSNVCNLGCSYCSPQFSSSWAQEAKKHGPYPTSNRHNDPAYFAGDRRNIPNREDNPYVNAFWEWWPELYPALKHFRMTGGEPMMDHNTYRVFDYVKNFPKPDLHLDVTSNFSVEPVIFEKYIKEVRALCSTQIEHFMQYVSLDSGIMSHSEYIRHGLNGELFGYYVDEYLTSVKEKNSLTFIVTMNNLSLLGMIKLLDWILELRSKHSHTYQRIWFDTPLLRQPRWQSLQVLPESYQLKLSQAIIFMEKNRMPDGSFVGFKDYEIDRMRRNLDWMREPQDPAEITQARADFYRFFNEHDHRRGTSFLRTFPEMREFWQECKYHAEA